MSEPVADPPAPTCSLPVSETGISEFQQLRPDLFSSRAHARETQGRTELTEQGAGDRLPFLFERRGRHRAAGAAVPAAGVAQVALDAVQIGVRPGALGIRLVLSALMR